MADFVQSPLFDNWFIKHKPVRRLVICAPYIKEDAIRKVFDQFDLIAPSTIKIDIFTTGRPEVFVSGGSDLSAIDFLSSFGDVTLYLIDNIHMKAYCIDDECLLVGSGNCTMPGLFPSGNVEAAISTNESVVINQFSLYCKSLIPFCLVLDSNNKISDYCRKLS